MATAIARTTDFAARPSLQRIAGMSSAMALHVVVFAVLLMPVAIPIVSDPPVVKATVTEVRIIEDEPIPLPPPPIPVPPQVQRRQLPAPVVAPRVAPLVTASEIVEPVTPHIPVPVDPRPAEIAAPGPVTMNTLAYVFAPPPPYPPAAKRKGWSGVVVLRILVDEAGLPEHVAIERSSGRALLDVTAAKQVRKWRFRPAVRDGVAVKAWASVPVDFTLIGR